MVRKRNCIPCRLVACIWTALLAFASVSVGGPSTSATYRVSADSIQSAGNGSTSTTYAIFAALGQATAIGAATGTTRSVSQGFLALAGAEFFPNAAQSAGLQLLRNAKGVAWGDYDGDAVNDLVVAREPGSITNYLFRNLGTASFSNSAICAGLTNPAAQAGLGWADADLDGDLDLFVRTSHGSAGQFWRNSGAAAFIESTVAAGLQGATTGLASCWGDYDGDGWVDLFIAGSSNQASRLYHNTSGGVFEDVAPAIGITNATPGSGTWADYDNDGDLDALIAQSGSAPLLFQNQNGTGFVEVAGTSGLTNVMASFGASWGDYDGDGWLDLYVINTGTNRDTLYRNTAGTFVDVTTNVLMGDTYDGRSAAWADFDGDGNLDLYVANRGSTGDPDIVYYNSGTGTFQRALTSDRKKSYGAAWADYDGDGDPDLAVTREDDAMALFRNTSSQAEWVRIRPLNGDGRQSCYGAQVRLYYAGSTNLYALRQVDGGHGTGCQDGYDVLVGIPSAWTDRFDIEVRFTRRGDPLGTGTNTPLVIDKNINPQLGGILPEDVGSGFVEVRENGRVAVTHGTLFVSGGEVWLLENSGTVRLLTTEGGDEPSGAPDGAKLVFSSTRNGNADLFTRPIAGGSDQALLTNTFQETQPAWATDGRAIAYTSDQNTNLDIYVVDTAGGGARNLTQHPSNDTDAAWSPNSAKIAFVSDRGGSSNIWIMDFDGANLSNLTSTVEANIEPSWSPDGLHIAFTSYRDGDAEVYVMNFDGTSPTNLSLHLAQDRYPTWNEKGTEIIFESNRDGTPRLYAIQPDGTGLRLLTPTMPGQRPSFPMSYKFPPKSVVFGINNGKISYWADPVNTEGGNFTAYETDFMLPGRGAPLEFTRFYNSQDPFESALGFGWRHSFMVNLVREVNGTVTITWGDAHQDFYQPFGSNSYTRIFGATPGTLKETGTGFDFRTPDAMTYRFSIAGRLVAISDRNSNTFTLVYDTNGLASVSQSNGRNLSFGYNSNRLCRVSDQTGRAICYGYDAAGDLVAVTNLRQEVWQYAYDDNHRLVKHVSPLGTAIVSNQYASVGRVSVQANGKGELTTYAYETDPTNYVSTTTITDPMGRVTRQRYDALRRLIGVYDQFSNAVTYAYDSFGNRIQATDRLGYTTRVDPTPVGLPQEHIDPRSNLVQVSYGPDQNPSSYLDELNRQVGYAYDTAGNLTSVTNPLGQTVQTAYNAYGQPVQMTDEKGRTTALNYSTNGDLVAVLDFLGRTNAMSYDALGRMVTRTDAQGNTWTYSYDVNNLVTNVMDPRNGQRVLQYDAQDRVVSIRSRLSSSEWAVVSNVYDGADRLIRRIDPRGNATTYGYDGYGNVSAVTNALGHATRLSYNVDNLVTQVIDAAGAAYAYEYDLNGRVLRQTMPGTNVTTYAYDAAGNVLAVTNGLGHSRTFEYDAAGQLVRMVDERGSQTTYGYDALGRVSAATNALGHVSRYAYDEAGNLAELVDPNTNSVKYGYDQVNNLSAITNALGGATRYLYDRNNRVTNVFDRNDNRTTYEYDTAGNLVRVTDPATNSLFYEYDLAGRLTKFTDSFGHSEAFEYDAAGNMVRRTDRIGNPTDYEYDALNRLVRVTNAKGQSVTTAYDGMNRMTNVTDHLGNSIAYAFDLAGRVVRITGPRGEVEQREYDRIGRLLLVQDPLLGIKTYEYDPTGNLTNFVDADGSAIRYQYDALNRRTRSDYPDVTSATYQYDPVGNLSRINEPLGVTSNRFDALNRLLSRRDVYGKTVSYRYDANGNVTNLVYPDGKVVLYGYDSLNRIVRVVDWLTNVTTYTFDLIGNLAAVTNGNGTRALYTYDDHQRLLSLRHLRSNDSVIAEQFFDYDPADNRVTERRNYPLLPSFTEGETKYSYDIANQVLTAGVESVQHDLKGNVIAKGSSTFTFDHANRLRQANGSGYFATYGYDDAGNRVSKTAFSGSFIQQRYAVDAGRSLPQVLTDNSLGNVEQLRYVYGISLLSRIDADGTELVFHTDTHGSCLAISDSSGLVVQAYAYGPYGETRSSGSMIQPFRYMGGFGITDEEFGLLYIRARYYDIDLGRFMSRDPAESGIGDPSAYSSYTYARSNPIGFTDITGLAPEPVCDDSCILKRIVGGPAKDAAEDLIPFHSEVEILEKTLEGDATGQDYAEYSAYGLLDELMYGTGAAVKFFVEGAKNSLVEIARGFNGLWHQSWEFRMNIGNMFDNFNVRLVTGAAYLSPPLIQQAGDNVSSSPLLDGAESTFAPLYAPQPADSIARDELSHGGTSHTNIALYTSYAAAYQQELAERRAARAARGPSKSQYKKMFAREMAINRQMEAGIAALTRGRGWESLSGQHGVSYSTATHSWYEHTTISYKYISGYWYWNVSRVVEDAVPRPTYSTWLSAHNVQRSAMRGHIGGNYTANGINTPWIPEVYEAYAIDGKFQVYGK